MMRRLLVTALLLMPALAQATLPVPYTAEYEVRRNGNPLGTATVVYKPLSHGRYELHSATSGSVLGISATVDEHSILRWNDRQPETISYSYRQEVPFSTRTRGIKVDAARGKIESSDKDKRFSPPYQPGVLDRNAITVALMQDIASGKTGDLSYMVPNKGELETHVYRTADSKRINTAMGAQRVVRVERIRESANGRTTTLWLGQDRNFVPLRILQKEPEGETLEMRIISIR